MKLGLLTGVLGDRDRRSAFALIKELGFDAVELGTGEFTTDVHAGLERLGAADGIAELRGDLERAGLELSALSCHGNPIHPNAAYAARADDVYRRTVVAASALGVENVIVFSGCAGEPGGGDVPNWVCTSWPAYFRELLDWQWSERVIPYWSEAARFAREHGCRIAVEMHPGMAVYNLPTLLALREACGPEIGANYDPSHLWWQGMDPLVVVRELANAGALFHVHAKDTALDADAIARSGVLETTSARESERAWRFATIGHGHDLVFWRGLVSQLRAVGYDGVLSVEHEDALAPVEAALKRSVAILEGCIWREPSAQLSWLSDPPAPAIGERRATTP